MERAELTFFKNAVSQLSKNALDEGSLLLLPLLGVTTDPPALDRRGFFGKLGLKSTVGIAGIVGLSSYFAVKALYEKFKKQPVSPTVYDTNSVFNEVKTPPFVNHPSIPTFQYHPTPVEAIGNRHIVEFLLGNLTNQLIAKRQERYKNDPAFRERVTAESLSSQSLSALLLVTDETRDRPPEDGSTDFIAGGGRSDVVMFVNLNPQTLKTMALSFPRDLFVPELRDVNIQDGGAKINNITAAPATDLSIDPYSVGRKVIESATGIPVDMIIQTNIDLVQGFTREDGSFQPGVFDRLFPDGLVIKVPSRLTDSSFPGPNYSKEEFSLASGEQLVDGKTIAKFTRTRIDSDYARDDRERYVVSTTMHSILIRVFQDLARGESTTLDTLVNSFEEQADASNLFFDLNIITIAKTVRNKLLELRSNAEGLAALSVLTVNTKKLIDSLSDGNFISFGMTRENRMVENVTGLERYFRPFMVRIRGSSTTTIPTEKGNFLDYWQPIREFTKQLIG